MSGGDAQGRPGSKDIEVYGDSAYADGATLEEQAARGHDMRTKVPPVRNPNGYSKDQFTHRSGRGHGHLPGSITA